MIDLNYLSRIFIISCTCFGFFVWGYFSPHHTKTHTVYIQPKPQVVTLTCPFGDIHRFTITQTTTHGRVPCKGKRDSHG